MSDVNLKLEDEDATDARPGCYADKRTFDVLQRYLKGKVSVQSAANEITAMLPDPSQYNTRGWEVGRFGSFLCQMAEQIPYSDSAQTRLVQLIQSVSLSPKLYRESDDDGYVMNCTMGDFKGRLREWSTLILDVDPDDPDEYAHGLNFAAFLARLTQSGFLHSPFPIWAMRSSLEEKIDHRGVLDCFISSVALWIVFAGQAIYTQVVEAPQPEKAGGIYRNGSLYRGPELGLERWAFWKEGLRAASEDKEASEECQRLAGNAAAFMDVIEQNATF